MPAEAEIAIIGAGIGGLSLALGLARAGKQSRVYEQAPVLAEVGAGVSLSPNTVKGLRYLGIGEHLEAIADESPTQVTRHFASGDVLVHIDRGNTREQLGAPYLQAHRADLHDLLRADLLALEPDALVLDTQLAAISTGTANRYALGFSDGSRATADILVGADGLKSTVRGEVFSESAPEFSGFVAWRGLVAGEALGVAQSRPGSMVFVAPGRMLVRYPVRHGKLQNFVAFSRADQWTAEGWSQTGEIETVRRILPTSMKMLVWFCALFPAGVATSGGCSRGSLCHAGFAGGRPFWAMPRTRCCRGLVRVRRLRSRMRSYFAAHCWSSAMRRKRCGAMRTRGGSG